MQQSYPAKNQANRQNPKKNQKKPQAYDLLGQPGNRITDDPSGRRNQQDSQTGGSPTDFDLSPQPWVMAAGPRRGKPLDFGGLFGSQRREKPDFWGPTLGGDFSNGRIQDPLAGRNAQPLTANNS